MKIRPDFILLEANGEAIVVKKGEQSSENGVPLHNEHAVFLWRSLAEAPCNKEQLLHALLKKYDISTVLALNDIDLFLKPLIEKGIIEP